MITVVIIDKLCKKKQLCSHCLIFWNIYSQIILNNLIQSFTLIIHLRMINSKKVLFNHLNLINFSLKIWSNVRIFIHHNVFQKVKTTFNMLKKKIHKVCSYDIILSEYKHYILCNMTHYSQNTVKFLIVLYWWRQSCDSI